jgi:hypothetical protein
LEKGPESRQTYHKSKKRATYNSQNIINACMQRDNENHFKQLVMGYFMLLMNTLTKNGLQ